MKIKMDINTLENHIVEIVNSSNSKVCKNYGFGVGVGLDILNEYLKDIANRALKIDDPIILFALVQIGVLKPSSDEEEKKLEERVKEIEKETEK